MPATLRAPANDILNRVAAEVGLEPVTDPYGSSQQEFKQMTYLLNICGEELCQIYPWEVLVREHAIVTQATDTGYYDLPDDFLYMINQTGWDRSDSSPLIGPLSAQEWQYMIGMDFADQPLDVCFRIQQGVFTILPQPVPAGYDIHFEYISRNWVVDSTAGSGTAQYSVADLPLQDRVKVGADTPLFDRTLLSRMLKVKFLEAKGLDSTKAQADANQTFQLLTSHDKGAPVLSAGGARGFPYISIWNVPHTGIGK